MAEPTTYERKTTETVQAMQFDGTAESAGRIWDWVMTETPYIADMYTQYGDVGLYVDENKVDPGYYVVLFDTYIDIQTAEAFEEEYRKPVPPFATGGYLHTGIDLTDAILGRR